MKINPHVIRRNIAGENVLSCDHTFQKSGEAKNFAAIFIAEVYSYRAVGYTVRGWGQRDGHIHRTPDRS